MEAGHEEKGGVMSGKPILVAVDGSPHAIRAAEHATKLADLMGCDIILMHCHRPFPVTLGEPYFQNAINKIMRKVDELLEPYRRIYDRAGIRFTERILEGPPAKAILNVAGIEEVEMIVMGSRGRTDLEGLLLGSVTHRVLHSAQCPVLVVR